MMVVNVINNDYLIFQQYFPIRKYKEIYFQTPVFCEFFLFKFPPKFQNFLQVVKFPLSMVHEFARLFQWAEAYMGDFDSGT